MKTCKECRNYKPSKFDEEFGHCRKYKVRGAISRWNQACEGYEPYN